MDLRKVKKLIELLEDSALVEMEISEGDSTIRLSRGGQIAAPAIQPAVAPNPVAHPVSPAPQADTAQSAAVQSSGRSIDSPMVGTFYESPSPDDPPYIEVGAMVNAGDVVCIIEAMKTFNQIEAEVSGKVTSINKQNGDPVEFGEALFTIE